MSRPAPIRRLVAALLATLQVAGCGPPWRRPDGVAPADVVNDWQPDVVRVTLRDGSVVTLSWPRARRDTLVGWGLAPAQRGTFALSRSDVVDLKARGTGVSLTLRDSSVIDIEDLWERADSLGGAGQRRSKRDTLLIPLADVVGVEVTKIPKPAQRVAAATSGGLPVSRGETIRVRVQETSGPMARHEYRGAFVRLAGDSLGLEAKEGMRWIRTETIERIDVLVGTHGHAPAGLLLGLLVGVAGAAAFVGANQEEPCVPPPNAEPAYCGDPGNAILAVYAIGGLIAMGGLIFGPALGAAVRAGLWEEVPLDRLRSPSHR